MQSQHQIDTGQRSYGNGAGGDFALLPNSEENCVELKYRSVENVASAKFAKGLALFSIGLGLAEVFMPAAIGEISGVPKSHRKLLPVLGAREIAHGVGIMMQGPKPTAAVWSRVGGDAIDLAFLGASFAGNGNNPRRLIGATAAVLGVAVLDILCAQKLSTSNWSESGGNPKAPTTVGQTSGRL